MTKPGVWSVTGALGFVALLLWGCGFGGEQRPAQYAALHPPDQPVVELRPVHIVPEKPRPVRSLLEMRRENVVIQTWDLSCGAAALATLLQYEFGDPVTEKEIAHGLMRRSEYVEHPELVQVREGFSLLDLKRYVQARGYKGQGFGQLEFNDLIERVPVMVPINALGYNHFAIFRGVKGNSVLLADPAWGNRTMTIDKFQRMWLYYGDPIGHVGFVVERADGREPPSRMQAKLSEFVMLQ
jgi:predicted double-glycine peptidase